MRSLFCAKYQIFPNYIWTQMSLSQTGGPVMLNARANGPIHWKANRSASLVSAGLQTYRVPRLRPSTHTTNVQEEQPTLRCSTLQSTAIHEVDTKV